VSAALCEPDPVALGWDSKLCQTCGEPFYRDPAVISLQGWSRTYFCSAPCRPSVRGVSSPVVSKAAKERARRPIPPPAIIAAPRPGTWRSQAACIGQDTELFFPPGSTGVFNEAQINIAKSYCRVCPVLWECLDEALMLNEYGVFGGLTQWERRQYRADLAKAEKATS
jgi:WhiB family transcriptional regulator, redox-sensing transcriptional regulator